MHSRILSDYFPRDRPSPSAEAQHDSATWTDLRQIFTDTFATRTREEWTSAFIGTDACVAPVLRPDELPSTPSPAPKLVRTPAASSQDASTSLEAGSDTEAVLLEAGLPRNEIEALAKQGIILVSSSRAHL